MFTIRYLLLSSEDIPAKTFIESLDVRLRCKVFVKLNLLSEFGYELREPHCKYLVDGIYELRIRDHILSIRLFYFYLENQSIIITHGFIKKTTKTPQDQIKKAQHYKQTMLNQHRSLKS